MTATAETTLRFPCKNCGAKLEFAPTATALTCGYCGYSEPVPSNQAAVVEYSFDDYKPESVGWDTALKSWECKTCGALTEREPHVTAASCVFCGSTQIQPMEQSPHLHKPESLLPFQVTRDQCIDLFRKWIKGLWFRPSSLAAEARADGLNGVYVPFWAYDALTYSLYHAERGDHYYETDDKGNRTQRTTWTWVNGTHSEFFDDVLAPGSASVARSLSQAIEPFDTKALVPYKPEYLAGLVAEDYRIDMPTAWGTAKSRVDDAIREACKRKVGGDTQRSLSIQTSYMNRMYKLCLLPIWIASYRFQSKSYSYLVNGQTGRVSGQAPFSWIKITLFVLALAAAIGGIAWLANR